jgi:hypothetical protein
MAALLFVSIKYSLIPKLPIIHITERLGRDIMETAELEIELLRFFKFHLNESFTREGLFEQFYEEFNTSIAISLKTFNQALNVLIKEELVDGQITPTENVVCIHGITVDGLRVLRTFQLARL